jgi:hypothetical protein
MLPLRPGTHSLSLALTCSPLLSLALTRSHLLSLALTCSRLLSWLTIKQAQASPYFLQCLHPESRHKRELEGTTPLIFFLSWNSFIPGALGYNSLEVKGELGLGNLRNSKSMIASMRLSIDLSGLGRLKLKSFRL